MPKRSPHDTPEYHLTVTPHLNERRQLPTTLVILETVQYFATFRYELSVDLQRDGNTLALTVRGLQAPDLSLPSSGHARFGREFDDLHGTVNVTVRGLNGRSGAVTLRISPQRVRIITPPADEYLRVTVPPGSTSPRRRKTAQ